MNALPAGTACPARVEGREPCKAAVKPGHTYCWRHEVDPERPRNEDRTRWCVHRLRGGGLCQSYALPDSPLCGTHAAAEQRARADLILALGGNPAALVALLEVLVKERGVSWERLNDLATRLQLKREKPPGLERLQRLAGAAR